MKQSEQVEKLREGIAQWLADNVSRYEVAPEKKRIITKADLAKAGSLLRNLPIPLYVDTGELTEGEMANLPLGKITVWAGDKLEPICTNNRKIIAKAARAKFKPVGEIMMEMKQ